LSENRDTDKPDGPEPHNGLLCLPDPGGMVASHVVDR